MYYLQSLNVSVLQGITILVGSINFKIAKRRAQTGNWEGAAGLWMTELNNPKAKITGRAYYNMAISNELT